MVPVLESIEREVRSGAGGAALPIDRAHLARYTFGSLPLEIEVLGLFAEQAPETLGMLATAEPGKPWRDAAHTLKGSARAVGAWRIAEAAEQAEELDGQCPAAREGAIEKLIAAIEEAIRYVDSLTAAEETKAA